MCRPCVTQTMMPFDHGDPQNDAEPVPLSQPAGPRALDRVASRRPARVNRTTQVRRARSGRGAGARVSRRRRRGGGGRGRTAPAPRPRRLRGRRPPRESPPRAASSRGRSAAARRGRADARTPASPSRRACAPLGEPGDVVTRVEGGVHVAGRRLRRARAGEGRRPRSPAAGRAARARFRRPSRAAGRRRGRTGRRRRSARPGSCRSSAGSGSGSVSLASRSAVAASELPPPRPAATGICFSIRTRQRGSTPAPRASSRSAARDERVAREALDPKLRRLLELDPVDEIDRAAGRSGPRACRRRAAARRRARG